MQGWVAEGPWCQQTFRLFLYHMRLRAPSIGIILRKSKDRLIVEYALKDATLPIGVSSYSVTPDVPNRLQGQLPSADQIASLLAGID